MSKYSATVQQKLPHLVVKYTRGETREKDSFAYGFVGTMPIAQLIGYITRVQAELAFRNPDPCDDCACVVFFNPQTGKMSWFVDSSIPVDALVGTLELVKCILVDSQVAACMEAMQAQQRTGLVHADGRPILKKGP